MFGTTTAHLVMVGDLPVDIVTGKAASVGYTIGITHGFGSRAQLKAAGADYVIDSLGEIEGAIEQIKKI
jgi:phosphoglycolate phosphatase